MDINRKRPYCRCLDEIRSGKTRTKFCFMPCADQLRIIEEEKQEAERRKRVEDDIKAQNQQR